MKRRTFALGLLALPLNPPQDLPPLHDAAAHGRTDEITRLLASNLALIHSLDKDGNTPLHHAAWNNQLEAARLLILVGANVNAARPEGKVTPLESAAYFGHFDMVKLLVSNKANVNVRVYDGYTPLHQAVRNGHVAVAQYLIEQGALLEAERDNGRRPLHTAAESGQLETTLYLLAVGANPTRRDKAGVTAVGVASNEAVRQALLRVLEARADTEARQAALALAAPKDVPIKKVEIVYESRFASGVVGPEWSTSALGAQWAELQIGTNKQGDRQFLGPLGSQEVRLAMGKLPVGGTGAVEKTAEGALYRLAYNLTHTSESVVVQFVAKGLEGLENESWALSGVRVATLSVK